MEGHCAVVITSVLVSLTAFVNYQEQAVWLFWVWYAQFLAQCLTVGAQMCFERMCEETL